MSDWTEWTEHPPPELIPQLRMGQEPFAVAAVWLFRNTSVLLQRVGPFITRAIHEAKPGTTPERAVHLVLQPVISVVFAEYLAATGIDRGESVDAQVVVKQFCQAIADMLMEQILFNASKPPAPNSGSPGRPN